MIKGKDILLRAVELSDAATIFDWENDSKLWHISGTRLPYSMYEIEQYVLNAGSSINIDLLSNKTEKWWGCLIFLIMNINIEGQELEFLLMINSGTEELPKRLLTCFAIIASQN
ncbi:MAG TPA: hypothetical protein PKE52_02070 [Bacteroidales bacterium]|nr:hypothetical protein [Bacteroidales bacterium]